MPHDLRTGIHYEVYGDGIPLVLGPPLAASSGELELPYRDGYLERLVDRYRVLVFDPPGQGQSTPIPAQEFVAERLCKSVLSVVDDAGFESFVWWGFSWGAVIGLQLACRSNRVSALVCGGWPPLGAEYTEILRACREVAANPPLQGPHVGVDATPFVALYESLQSWNEAKEILKITCPRMTYVGSEDVGYGSLKLHLAESIRERREELENIGWRVAEIPGRDHAVFTDPSTVVPLVREFLDAAL